MSCGSGKDGDKETELKDVWEIELTEIVGKPIWGGMEYRMSSLCWLSWLVGGGTNLDREYRRDISTGVR